MKCLGKKDLHILHINESCHPCHFCIILEFGGFFGNNLDDFSIDLLFLGPPVAKEKDLKHIARKGDDIKIHCPITGKPEPIIEWYKGDEKIDFTWIRLKAARGNLKIR